MKTCTCCKGTGKVEVRGRDGVWIGPIPCELCRGFGEYNPHSIRTGKGRSSMTFRQTERGFLEARQWSRDEECWTTRKTGP